MAATLLATIKDAVRRAPGTAAESLVQPTVATVSPLVLKGHAAQSADLLKITNSADEAQFRIAANGSAIGEFLELVKEATEGDAPELHFVGRRGRWIVGIDVFNAPLARDMVLLGRRNDYYVHDAATTSGSATLTSAAEGGFTTALIGASISGAGIPNGTTITAVAGPTSLTMSAPATATAAGVRVYIDKDGVGDIIYIKHRGALPETIGLGITPPDALYRVQIAASDTENALGGLSVRVGPSQTGHPFAVRDSAGGEKVTITKDFRLKGHADTNGLVVLGVGGSNDSMLTFRPSGGGGVEYGFTSGGTDLRFRYLTGGVNVFAIGTDSRVFFYTKPNVTNAGIQMRHVGGATPSGGDSGDMVVGTGKVWYNDGGTWKSAAFA